MQDNRKKVAIIGTVGIPAKYGGFETLVEYLTKELQDDFKFTVFCSSKRYAEKRKVHNGAELKYVPLLANGPQSILYDVISMVKSPNFADTLLILGTSGCVILPFFRLFSKKKIIVNIDGMEWKRARWRGFAKRFLKLSEKMAVRYADVVIADNKVIQQYISVAYAKKSALIAYGADHAKEQKLTEETRIEYPFLVDPYTFKVCRIEPENNVHVILKAFASQKHMNLIIIGNWSNSEYGKRLKQEYEDISHIHLLDPIYNQRKLNEIRSNCAWYIHGHSAGGTNPSLVEAMYLGLPILCFDVDYNRETTDHQAVFFKNPEELTKILNNLDAFNPNELGCKMKLLANDRYLWKQIAEKYSRIF